MTINIKKLTLLTCKINRHSISKANEYIIRYILLLFAYANL